MHVVLDCRYAFPHLSGIGRYIVELARELAREVAADNALKVTVLAPSAEAFHHVAGPLEGPLTVHPLASAPRHPGQQLALPRLLRSLHADLFHTPDAFAPLLPLPPFRPPCPTVITLHDLIPLACPGATGLKAQVGPLWRMWLSAQCRSAGAILTGSRHALSDITRLLHPDPAKLHVVPPGVRIPPASPTNVLSKLGLSPRGFLLYVGRRDPYKNVDGCVRLLARLKQDHPDTYPHLKLVLAGFPDPRYPQPDRERDRLGLGDAVLTPGHLTDPEIAELYTAAAATLMLSTYEGFGYPVIESQARGTPVLCSNTTSLPEVAAGTSADAALLTDPADEPAAAAALHRLLTDTPLRDTLIAKGLANARRFTVESQAAQTLAVYRRVTSTL